MKYCNACDRMVQPSKKFSIGWFLILNVFYLPYWIFLKGKACPICGNKGLHSHK